MDLIDFLFDQGYFCNTPNAPVGCIELDWHKTLETYKTDFLPHCFPPNNFFAPLSVIKEDKCSLVTKWTGEFEQDNLNRLEFRVFFNKHCNNMEESSYLTDLFKTNMHRVAVHDPKNIENIIKFGNDKINIVAMQALQHNYNHSLSEETLEYLEQYIVSNRYPIIIESATLLLTNHAIHHLGNFTHLDFLINFASNNTALVPAVIEKFVGNITICSNTEVLDRMSLLLPYNTDGRLLNGLLQAHVLHNYTASISYLDSFITLTENSSLSRLAKDFITNSIIRILKTKKADDNAISKVEYYVYQLLHNTFTIEEKIALAVIDFYDDNQSYFEEFLVDYAAEDKFLSSTVADKLEKILPLMDIKSSLLIAERLLKRKFKLSDSTVKLLLDHYNAKSLSNIQDDDNTHTKELFSKFYESLNEAEKHNYKYEIVKETPVCSEVQAISIPSDFISNLPKIHYRALRRSVNFLINEAKWPACVLTDFLNIVSEEDALSAVSLIEKIADYNIKPHIINRHGISALKIITNFLSDYDDFNKIELLIPQLIRDNNFLPINTLSDILQVMQQDNAKNENLLELIRNGYFIAQLQKVEKGFQYDKPLNTWEEQDFLNWRKNIGHINDDNIAEVLSVLSQAIYNTAAHKEYYPRQVQLLAVLVLYKIGGVIQIDTGEGKTLILAMFEDIQVLKDSTVDSATSDAKLATRDIEDYQTFHALLGATSAHNIVSRANNVPLECYTKNIVHGDMRSSIGDILQDTSSITNIRSGRKFDVMTVDECDYMFMDQTRMKVQLSSYIPGFDSLSPLQIYIHGQAQSVVLPRLRPSTYNNGCYIDLPVRTDGHIREFDNYTRFFNHTAISVQSTYINSSCTEYFKEYLNKYIPQEILPSSKLPSFLYGFVKNHYQRWVESLISALQYTENEHYITQSPGKKNNQEFTTIVPVDKESGEIQNGVILANGIHQFSQIKHGLTLTPEGLTTTYLSYPGLFKKYKGRLYGVTGTVGTDLHRQFLKDNYGIETTIIPPFVKKDFTMLPAIFVSSEIEWKKEILGIIERKIASKRAGLTIVDSIIQVDETVKYLKEHYAPSKVFVYCTGDKLEDKDYNLKRVLQAGEVIVATTCAGRGIDPKISNHIIRHGGLHVIEATFPLSSRIKDQNFFRSARKGEPGSGQYVLNTENLPIKSCGANITCLEEERDRQEEQRLKRDTQCTLPAQALRDGFYESFLDLKMQVNSPTNYTLRISGPSLAMLEPRSVYAYFKNNTLELAIVKEKSNAQDAHKCLSNISEILDIIAPNVKKHLEWLFSTHDATSITPLDINGQDYESIHFIAALNNFTDYPEIMERVHYRLGEAINDGGFNDENTYLNFLLHNSTDFSDLYSSNNTQAIQNAALRKTFHLWLEDRKIFNNHYEIQQILLDWGMWSKRFDESLNNETLCNITDEDGTSKRHKDLEKKLREEFEQLKKEINDRHNSGELMQNPGYLVLKAWQYVDIYNDQQKLKDQKLQYEQAKQQSMDQQNIPEKESFFSTHVATVATWLSNFGQYLNDLIWQPASSVKVSVGSENYDPTDPLGKALGFLQRAHNLDNNTWAARIASAYISILKDGNLFYDTEANEAMKLKIAVINHLSKAVRIIEDQIISALDETISALLTHKMVEIKDDLSIQLIGTKELFITFSSAIRNNIAVAERATENENVRIGRYIPLEEVTKDVNITATLLNIFNQTENVTSSVRLALNDIASKANFTSKNFVLNQFAASGVAIFELSTYKLEEEDSDWFGTIFAGILGIASIVIGIGLITIPGAGIFTATFGSSLVMQGISDIIQSLISISTDKPIDMGQYLSSKGMALGIALVTSGTLHFINHIDKFQNLGLGNLAGNIVDKAKNIPDFLTKMIAIQGLTTLFGAALYNQAKGLISEEDIAEEAANVVDRITSSHQEQLLRIFATDRINGNMRLQKALYEKIRYIISQYQKKFHDDKTTFGVGVGTGLAGYAVGGANIFQLVGLGGVIDATTKFSLGYLKNLDAMRNIESKTKAAIEKISAQAMNIEEITARNIDRDTLLAGAMPSFKEHFIYTVSKNIKAVQLNEMVCPWTNLVASELGDTLGNKVADYINIKRAEAQRQALEAASQARRAAEFATTQTQEVANENIPKKSSTKGKVAKGKKASSSRSGTQKISAQDKSGNKHQNNDLPIDSLLGQKQMESFEKARQDIDNVLSKTVAERQAAKADFTKLEKSLSLQAKDQTFLKKAGVKIEKLYDKYPWAGTAIMSIRLVILAGATVYSGGSLTPLMINELKGYAVGAVAGSAIEAAINKEAAWLLKKEPSLTERQAIILAGLSVAAIGFVADTKSVFKGMNRILKKADLNRGYAFAHATSGSSKNTRFGTDAPDKNSNILFKKSSSNSGGGKGISKPSDSANVDTTKIYKKSHFEKGDYVDLNRFTQRLNGGNMKDPKSGQFLERDWARGRSHNSYWKLKDGKNQRLGTFTKEGKFLRE